MAKKYYPIKQQPLYSLFLLLSIIWTLAGILTLIYNPQANKPNIMGYYSLCPFAPAATLFCFTLAGITCLFRATYFKKDSHGRHSPFKAHGITIILILLLFGGGIISAFLWHNSSQIFRSDIVTNIDFTLPFNLPDGIYSGTWSENEVTAEVKLVINNGKLESGQLISGKNVPARIADTMFQSLITKQSLNIDTVTGATATCSVVLKACEQALQPAENK